MCCICSVWIPLTFQIPEKLINTFQKNFSNQSSSNWFEWCGKTFIFEKSLSSCRTVNSGNCIGRDEYCFQISFVADHDERNTAQHHICPQVSNSINTQYCVNVLGLKSLQCSFACKTKWSAWPSGAETYIFFLYTGGSFIKHELCSYTLYSHYIWHTVSWNKYF